MALKDLIAAPGEVAASRLELFARQRVKVLQRAWDTDGCRPLSPWRFRLQEARLFQREIERLIPTLQTKKD